MAESHSVQVHLYPKTLKAMNDYRKVLGFVPGFGMDSITKQANNIILNALSDVKKKKK